MCSTSFRRKEKHIYHIWGWNWKWFNFVQSYRKFLLIKKCRQKGHCPLHKWERTITAQCESVFILIVLPQDFCISCSFYEGRREKCSIKQNFLQFVNASNFHGKEFAKSKPLMKIVSISFTYNEIFWFYTKHITIFESYSWGYVQGMIKKCPKNWFLQVNLYRVPNLSATPYSCPSFLYFAFHIITTCLREWWSVPYHGGISSTVSLFLTICCFTAHELFNGFHSQQCMRSPPCPDGSSSRDHGNVWTMGGLISFVILPFRIHPSSLR